MHSTVPSYLSFPQPILIVSYLVSRDTKRYTVAKIQITSVARRIFRNIICTLRNEMRKLNSTFEARGLKISEAISFAGILSGIHAAEGPNTFLIFDYCHSEDSGAFRRIRTVWIVMSATPLTHNQRWDNEDVHGRRRSSASPAKC